MTTICQQEVWGQELVEPLVIRIPSLSFVSIQFKMVRQRAAGVKGDNHTNQEAALLWYHTERTLFKLHPPQEAQPRFPSPSCQSLSETDLPKIRLHDQTSLVKQPACLEWLNAAVELSPFPPRKWVSTLIFYECWVGTFSYSSISQRTLRGEGSFTGLKWRWWTCWSVRFLHHQGGKQ